MLVSDIGLMGTIGETPPRTDHHSGTYRTQQYEWEPGNNGARLNIVAYYE
jgi:hypothetical protein